MFVVETIDSLRLNINGFAESSFWLFFSGMVTDGSRYEALLRSVETFLKLFAGSLQCCDNTKCL